MKALLLSMTLILSMGQAKAFDTVKDVLTSIVAYPIVSTSIFTCALGDGPCLMSKEVVAVKGDAQDYLAGEEATDSLIKAVELLKTNAPELNNVSDEEIIKMIATLE